VLSYENCTRRSPEERAVLDELLVDGLRDLRKDEIINGERLRVSVVGDLGLVSQAAMDEAMALGVETAQYSGGSLHLGVCYSGEWERQMLVLGMGAPSLIAGVPPIDLVIRTGSMRRLSGFFPMQATYAELYFTDTLWPEFNREELKKALEWYEAQKKNFGA